MQHNDPSSTYYQHYQPPLQNPNLSSTHADQPYNPAPLPSQYASAPPVASDDCSNYASTYLPYSQPSADHAHNLPAPFPSNPRTNYGNSFENNSNYGSYGDQGLYESGVYKYNGKKEELYSGNQSQSSAGLMFDDYERPINVNSESGREQQQHRPVNTPEIVKATPKVEDQQDATGGVLKFRVKLLSEGIGQSDMDVLCQIGLDGIRILEPATSRTLRIYSLENVTKLEVLDSYIFAFWAKTSVDNEAKRIRLKSNSYTTNNILDAVTTTSIQVKQSVFEIVCISVTGYRRGVPISGLHRISVPDEAIRKCTACGTNFNAFVQRHHCRNCGDIFCDKCTQGRTALTADEDAQPVRVCDSCMTEVTQRLSNAKAAVRVVVMPSHVDLAKKLQEEMDKKWKTSRAIAMIISCSIQITSFCNGLLSGTGVQSHTSQGSRRMREVACPTCTVHLQVEVPASGSETIECSVCQHPFLVSAH
ncbi:hypothetical protein MTR67_009980 [Solanum verrucosum]|uniref:FYVE-type domain-containing protein n=1 Tax=Solanum verrucosum TaxID=315347 RepID=A0AAF0Q6Q6_SOLVR|nr:hypothetical protein MTR67_009980 [Solanum verrucosum]